MRKVALNFDEKEKPEAECRRAVGGKICHFVPSYQVCTIL